MTTTVPDLNLTIFMSIPNANLIWSIAGMLNIFLFFLGLFGGSRD